MAFPGADFEMKWPAILFLEEVEDVSVSAGMDWQARIEILLEEAFAGPAARDQFRAASQRGILPGGGDGQDAFLNELLAAVPNLRLASEPRPYYPQRQSARSDLALGPAWLRREFIRFVGELHESGYLERSFPDGCVDDRDFVRIDKSDVLQERLGVADLWQLSQSEPTWDDDTFYGLIEVFHDLVARPRSRWFHDYSSCGWHYSNFALNPARQLYRWRLNRMLERSGTPLLLAEDGEDIGRLIATTDAGRADLTNRLLEDYDPTKADRVRHAVALFRARGASVEEKRSAVIAMAGILEDRRKLLKESLFRKDEGALFEIANEFSIRHRSEQQKSDYDPAFLDWIFWWYAATVELTNQIISRSGD